jgi:hypothetical protein
METYIVYMVFRVYTVHINKIFTKNSENIRTYSFNHTSLMYKFLCSNS